MPLRTFQCLRAAATRASILPTSTALNSVGLHHTCVYKGEYAEHCCTVFRMIVQCRTWHDVSADGRPVQVPREQDSCSHSLICNLRRGDVEMFEADAFGKLETGIAPRFDARTSTEPSEDSGCQ